MIKMWGFKHIYDLFFMRVKMINEFKRNDMLVGSSKYYYVNMSQPLTKYSRT